MSSQSLPSFAQAFSALDDRDRALPPIHPHSPYLRHDPPPRHDLPLQHVSHSHPHPSSLPPLKRENRKRPLERNDDSEPESPRLVKQEQDVDQLDPSPPPPLHNNTKSPPRKAPSPARPTTRARQQLHLNTNVANITSSTNNANATNASTTTNTNAHAHAHAQAAAPPPPPSLARQQHNPPSKRRRVTISGVAHPSMHSSSLYTSSPAHSNAHTPPPGGATHTGPSTPISPVVMGFTIQRDPQAVEQVRAMLAVKQKQKALIESRRGSAAGLAGMEGVGGRRGSTAGVLESGGGSVSGRRASVAAPSVTVNIVNPTPTTATGPGPSPGPGATIAPPLRRTGSSPNGHRLAATPPSLSPKTRATANRTRSPSLLGGGVRAKSPSPHGIVATPPSRAGPPPPPPPAPAPTPVVPPPAIASNLSPPSHHPHSQSNPHQVSTRPHIPSPPHTAATVASAPLPPPAAPPSSSPPSTHTSTNLIVANSNSNSSSQGQGQTSNSGSAQGQNQSQKSPSNTFVASQGLSALAHNLPPPPNSFTRRRAAQLGLRGNKPADLMISPRDSESGPPPSGHRSSGSQHQQQQQQHPPPQTQSHSQTHSHSHSHSTSHSHTHSQSHRALPLRRGMQMPAAVPLSASLKSVQPAIQSAPPRPGQQPGRFPMTLPSLPPAMGRAAAVGGSAAGSAPQPLRALRKIPGQVPPTPTRLSMQRAQGTTESASVRLSQPASLSRVPRTATGATFAIPHGPGPASTGTAGVSASTSLMPVTPATLHRASAGSSEKAAFLAPFEQFYDALTDAQVLKGWFGEQLRRVGAIVKEGDAQLAKLKAANKNNNKNNSESSGSSGMISKAEVENLVREAVAAESRTWREEVSRLRAHVAELQDALERGQQQAVQGYEREPGNSPGGRLPVNGLPVFQPTPPTSSATVTSSGVNTGYPTAPGVDSYTFPPVPVPAPRRHVPALGPPPPSSGSLTLIDDRERGVPLRRSISPPFRARDTSEGAGAGGVGFASGYGGGGGTRSLSRSAASSPAPSLEGGIGRRLSVSAMRFEKLERVEPRGLGSGPAAEEKEGAREKGGNLKPESRRPNSGPNAKARSSASTNANANGSGNGGVTVEGTKREDTNANSNRRENDAMDEC